MCEITELNIFNLLYISTFSITRKTNKQTCRQSSKKSRREVVVRRKSTGVRRITMKSVGTKFVKGVIYYYLAVCSKKQKKLWQNQKGLYGIMRT